MNHVSKGFRNRDRIGIMRQVLLGMKNNEGPSRLRTRTKIMMFARLSNDQSIRILEDLVNCGVLSVEQEEIGHIMRRFFNLTQKGRDVLNLFEEIDRTFPFMHVFEPIR
jgi:predicted transcriptional regulator